MQGKIFAYKKSKYSKHMKEKHYTWSFTYKSMATKNNFILENILFSGPQEV
jgi:hypothetical protein